jgi:phospholipase/carboxylesterase
MAEAEIRHDKVSGLVYRLRLAKEGGPFSFVMLHGLSGNEDVMWVLESALPSGALVAAPRAPNEFLEGGYTWLRSHDDQGSDLKLYRNAAEKVEMLVVGLIAEHQLDPPELVLVGFSQGAAIAFAVAARGEVPVCAVVALAAYLPQGDLASLAGLPVFWGHGILDETIPIARAKEDQARLVRVGANVHACDAEVGHKVGVECVRGLKQWLRQLL